MQTQKCVWGFNILWLTNTLVFLFDAFLIKMSQPFLLSFTASLLWKQPINNNHKVGSLFHVRLVKRVSFLLSQNSFTPHFMAYVLRTVTVWPSFRTLDSFYSVAFRVVSESRDMTIFNGWHWKQIFTLVLHFTILRFTIIFSSLTHKHIYSKLSFQKITRLF